MDTKNKIDVIIPAQNVPDNLLFRCLSSIACQTIVSDLVVTIVDDASTKQNYKAIVKHFKSIMKINILRLKQNGGPGVARQYGLDHTSCEFFTFIDADDTFQGAYALQTLRACIGAGEGAHIMCVGNFAEIKNNNYNMPILVCMHENDLVWVFGKLIRRSYINKYNIRFHKTSRANEDAGFNKLIYLCCDETETINYISEYVYNWHEVANSITRINDCQYSFGASKNDCFYGYVENMIYAINEAKIKNINNIKTITMFSLSCMIHIWHFHIQCAHHSPKTLDQNFEYCKMYYNEIYKNIEPDITEEDFINAQNDVMRLVLHSCKLNNYIPYIGIYEFLDKLKQES